MDGNRTYPGRLNSAPQTVLKTAVLTSANGCGRARTMKIDQRESVTVRFRSPGFAKMAVSLAVKTEGDLATFSPIRRGSNP